MDNQKPWYYLTPDFQRQLDADGTFVGVSRQALDETLAQFAATREALERLLKIHGDDECWRDHHGYCQEHYLEEDCSVGFARKVGAANG